MAKYLSLPLMTDAYIADTQHLTNEEHGVYLRLLMFAWRSPDCRLPDDDRRLAIMVGVTARRWSTLKPAVMAFWDCADGFWTQKKLLSQRDFVQRSLKQKIRGRNCVREGQGIEKQQTGLNGCTNGKPNGPTNRNATGHSTIHIHIQKERKERT